ncbi:MAG: type I methionyl aminopeptidase [Candidatus Sungbacteria bacterium]|nr:type I methionyl aminopeptidase [Candidatus Sungbacteria bacterium]
MAITIKTKQEIDLLREGGKRLAEVLSRVAGAVAAGISTYELDLLGEKMIQESGGVPSFKGYASRGSSRPYPASLCISVNDEIVHAIPRKNAILKEGDIVGLDIGMWWPVREGIAKQNGRPDGALCTDMAITVGVGSISKEAERLMRATKESLDIGIQAVRAGVHIGDIGAAIEARLKKDKLGIIRDLAGHGVGYQLHEDPLIPNFGKPYSGVELKEDMVIAIEPMATLGDWRVILADDQWTFKTADGSLGAHFEHTMAVTREGAEVLTKI